MQFPSKSRSSSTVMGLWVYAFRARQLTCNHHCIFGTSNYKLRWIFSESCDRWRALLNYWCPCNRHETKRSIQGKTGIIGKETDALDPYEHFYVTTHIIVLVPPASCWVWGEGVTLHDNWRSCGEIWKSFCYMLHRVICVRLSSCHYLISVISSISSLVVLNGWRRRRHGAF
jgi:hypothetical protein